jgi:hypothetical protein
MAPEIKASKVMLGRIEERHGITPERLAADKAYGTGLFLAWLSARNLTPHIPVLDRQQQIVGLLPRETFTFDPERNVFICLQAGYWNIGRRDSERRRCMGQRPVTA